MPPKVKFSKEEIVKASLDVVSSRGLEALTAREVAKALGVSTRPIFTHFRTMDQLKAEIRKMAIGRLKTYIEEGLRESIPFIGVGRAHLRFAKKEPELFKILFLHNGGSDESLKIMQSLALKSVMESYNMNEFDATCYIRDMWLVVFSFTTMIVTNSCPFTDRQIEALMTELSLSVCKAYKEVPGLSRGEYDRDAVFGELIRK